MREFYICRGELFRYAKGIWWHLDAADRYEVVQGSDDPRFEFRMDEDIPISHLYARLKGWPE